MREKIKQYRYASLEDGCRYLHSYESISEVHNKWYDGAKYPLYRISDDFHELPDGSFISHYRIGREELKKQVRKSYDPTIYKRVGDRKIEIYNGNNELVGVLRNSRILQSILNSSYSTTQASLHNSSKSKRYKSPTFGNLTYKYK